MKQLRGYTLIELLATLSIIGIISAFAIPNFKNLVEKEKATSTAFALFHDLQFARATAVNRNRTVTVCASAKLEKCSKNQDWSNKPVMVFIDTDGNGDRSNKEELLKVINFNLENHSLIWRSFGNKTFLQWHPDGMTYYQNGNFTYCPASKNVKNSKRIILNATGRVYFGADKNKDGIPEGADGKNTTC